MNEDQGLTAQQFNALVEADDDRVGQLAAEYLGGSDGDLQSDVASPSFGWSDITGFVDRHRREFHQAICVDWDACGKLQSLDGSALQTALQDAIGPLFRGLTGAAGWIVRGSLPVLISLAAVYIMRQSLKAYCGCS